MKIFLLINKNFIIRESDKMIFSAKDMKIFKFNERGFLVVKTIDKANKIEKQELFNLLKKSDNYSDEELTKIINKMLKNKIIIQEEI